MQIKEIIGALERFAPLPLQDGFDNAGLQVGLTEVEATGALCLDVTEKVVDEAVRRGCNLIVSHHPLLFRPLKSVTGRNYIERCLIKALQNGVVIYSAHTNLDNVRGGVSFKMAEKLGLTNVCILDPKEEQLIKLVTYVPTDYTDSVAQALYNAGCGHIGNYDCCSFQHSGHGTFRALEGSNPFCGMRGELHTENEVKIETVVPAYDKARAVKALIKAHPYEEPVFDLFALQNSWLGAGSGVIGEYAEPISEIELLHRLKECFSVECVRHNVVTDRRVKRVALCGGAGAFLLSKAISEGADAFITGEIHYHDYFGHDGELLMAEIGHYESEQFTSEILFDVLSGACSGLKILKSEINTNPIKYN
jgi:dinuclear metal center YbgI/SA1388 family protein